jgi:hypothetical protein
MLLQKTLLGLIQLIGDKFKSLSTRSNPSSFVTSLSSSREACPAKTNPSLLFPKSSMKTKFATGIYNSN